jgi:hypothetical protein
MQALGDIVTVYRNGSLRITLKALMSALCRAPLTLGVSVTINTDEVFGTHRWLGMLRCKLHDEAHHRVPRRSWSWMSLSSSASRRFSSLI